ncbi:hypothetical protein [Nocardia higoensis]|uniref:hypothetical protein n=1 Tax=Nocardia higoensis TaxID=228599 RepID=UPI0012F6478B|nr:hypothetical protein [Nocardia higoensis]
MNDGDDRPNLLGGANEPRLDSGYIRDMSDGPDLDVDELSDADWDEIDPEGIRNAAPLDYSGMTVVELEQFVRNGDPRGSAAIVELVDRAGTNDTAARIVAELAKLRSVRDDKFNLYSFAEYIIVNLLTLGTQTARDAAILVFETLDHDEQVNILQWLNISDIRQVGKASS